MNPLLAPPRKPGCGGDVEADERRVLVDLVHRREIAVPVDIEAVEVGRVADNFLRHPQVHGIVDVEGLVEKWEVAGDDGHKKNENRCETRGLSSLGAGGDGIALCGLFLPERRRARGV